MNGQIAESEYRQYHSPATFKHYKYVYDYDRMGRLLGADFRRSEQGGWTNASTFDVSELSYDANGNLLKLKRHPNTGGYIDNLSFAYTSGTNKLNILTDAAGAQASWDASTMLYAYDQRGNVTYREDFGRSHIDYLTYDERNQLIEFERINAFTTAYRYSAGGEHYWKKTAGQTGEYYVLDGAETIGVFREDGTYHWNVLVGGAPVGRITNTGAVRFYVKDHLGSTRTVVNSAGTVMETRDFYPFGLQMPGRTYLSGTAAKEDFTGHELDVETGLHYAGARYLDAAIGRWLAVDPLADEYPAWSPFNYVMNNPGVLIDPDGRAPSGGECPPNCNFEGVVRSNFGWAESGTTRVAEMLADIQETTSDAIRTVVTEGPEKLDGVTYAAGMTAVAAGGAAMIAGPTPDDAIHLTVAGIAATTATLSNTAATVLSVIDAAVYGSNEAKLRLTTTLTTFLVGRYVASRAHQPATQTLQNATRAEGATKATSVASGAAAGAAAEKVLEERAEDEGN